MNLEKTININNKIMKYKEKDRLYKIISILKDNNPS